MFDTVLVANRGEIAVRVLRTLRRLDIRSVAVHTPADAHARHVREADEAVSLNAIPPAAAGTAVPGGYLDGEAIIAAAMRTGAQAIHPGYGFLAENAAFARACAEAGLVFIGPPPSAIEAMGDKIRAKRTVAAAGVPVVPGRDEAGLSDKELAAAAREVGLPVLLKPSAGGGGKGMRLVRDAAELTAAIEAARREAKAAFGDDTLLVERFVGNPRHIEIQVFADAHGEAVHFGERECSLQRRHQKIVEEAPSPLLDAELRARMGESAVAAAKAVGYVGAGTVEYIVSADRPDDYYFMEMNTRLQVEHPVTEMAAVVSRHPGLDLVELQLRVAAGEPLPFGQDAIGFEGHAIEARVYAEDPARGFLPTGGRILALAEPGSARNVPGSARDQPASARTEPPFDVARVRVDSGIAAGDEVGSSYDPMLAKVIAWGEDRATALRALDRALGSYTLLGVPTNVAFLRRLITHPKVVAGDLDTGLVERVLPELAEPADLDHVLVAAALERMAALEIGDGIPSADPASRDPWAIPDGWRLGEPARTPWIITPAGHDPVEVRVRGLAADAEVSIAGGPPASATLTRTGTHLTVSYAGRTVSCAWARDGETLWLGHGGRAWALTEHVRGETGGAAAAAGDGVVRSPMPGTVLAVKAAEGDVVTEGQPLVIVEAMKMEHTVTAPISGTLTGLPARAGAQVALDETLAVIEQEG